MSAISESIRADPVSELRGVVSAGRRRACAATARSRRPRLERPPQAEFGDYSTNAAMLLAPSLGEPPRAIAERLGETLGERLGARGGEGRGRRARLPQPVHDRRLVPRLAGADAGGRRPLRRGATGGRARPGRVRERQPDRADHRGLGAPRRLRRLAGAHPRARRATASSASTTSTTPARQVRRFGESIQARARGEEPPEDGYHGRLRDRAGRSASTAPPTPTRTSWRGAASS